MYGMGMNMPSKPKPKKSVDTTTNMYIDGGSDCDNNWNQLPTKVVN
jgi:hypothetical protein